MSKESAGAMRDVGCGPAPTDAMAMARRAAEWTGLDMSCVVAISVPGERSIGEGRRRRHDCSRRRFANPEAGLAVALAFVEQPSAIHARFAGRDRDSRCVRNRRLGRLYLL